jgi:asparagine synthase (glutamine-hydrolysing)
MSGLCGWFCSDPAGRADPLVITAMARSLNRFDGSGVRHASAPFGAIAAAGDNSDVYQDDERLVAVVGKTRSADPRVAELPSGQGVARALAQAYARKGTGILNEVCGAFAIAVIDGRSGEAMLAIDRMGTRPLCYSMVGGVLVFGSTLDAIAAFPTVAHRVNRQAIYDYVYFHMVPGPFTIRAGEYRLPPGSLLLCRDGKIETRPYWEMRFVENERRPFPQLKRDFLTVLREGVSHAAQDRRAGAFLSGGTDSSTIAGLLGQVTGEPARTYSIGFDADNFDEMCFARIAARHFGTRHHEYYVTPDDVVAAIPSIAAVHDQPFGNASAVPTFYCAKLAKDDGIEVLLGGDGGDELFGGNERYGKQYLYSLYGDLPAPLRRHLIEPVAGLLPAVSIVGKAQRYMKNASMPMPARYDNYNLLERIGPATVFTPEFIGSVDPELPSAQMARQYDGAHARSLINRMLALDLKYTLADNDLPKVSRSCELAGIDARYPMLDDRVVAFSAHLAPRLKLRGTHLRYFFKEALRGFLPNEILSKTKHGFGLPFGPWLQTHRPLRQIALDGLSDLKKRGIVRPEFIDELTSTHVQTHARYYGTMVWVLMMLEFWLKEHDLVV